MCAVMMSQPFKIPPKWHETRMVTEAEGLGFLHVDASVFL